MSFFKKIFNWLFGDCFDSKEDDFEKWKQELSELIYDKFGPCPDWFSWDDWRDYFDSGYTPEQALMRRIGMANHS